MYKRQKYTFQSFTGSLSQMQGVAAFDANFGATAGGNVFWQLVGMAVTVVIMAFGIGRGIETVSYTHLPSQSGRHRPAGPC